MHLAYPTETKVRDHICGLACMEVASSQYKANRPIWAGLHVGLDVDDADVVWKPRTKDADLFHSSSWAKDEVELPHQVVTQQKR